MRHDELRQLVEKAGWRVDLNHSRDEMNTCGWYAWMSRRQLDWPDCECNDKPPSFVMWPSFLRLPDGREVSSVEFEVCGEMAGRWFKLKMYSVRPDEAIEAAKEAAHALGAAWRAIATNAHNAPTAEQAAKEQA